MYAVDNRYKYKPLFSKVKKNLMQIQSEFL